jgi:osmotically-inducible protein OsmY
MATLNDNSTAGVFDAEIKQAIDRLMTDHPKLDAEHIEVVVADRAVTLQGKVDTEEEKGLAYELATSVTGVRSVVNSLHTSIGLAHALTSIASRISAENEKNP